MPQEEYTMNSSYSTILNHIEALVAKGLAFVESNGHDYAIGLDAIEDVEITLEVTGNWEYQITLFAGRDIYQTRNATDAAHMVHYATVEYWQTAAQAVMF